MKPGFIVVDEHTCSYVHCVHEQKSFLDSAFFERSFDIWSDIDYLSPGRGVEEKFLPV
jgi:hypothetical protein